MIFCSLPVPVLRRDVQDAVRRCRTMTSTCRLLWLSGIPTSENTPRNFCRPPFQRRPADLDLTDVCPSDAVERPRSLAGIVVLAGELCDAPASRREEAADVGRTESFTSPARTRRPDPRSRITHQGSHSCWALAESPSRAAGSSARLAAHETTPSIAEASTPRLRTWARPHPTGYIAGGSSLARKKPRSAGGASGRDEQEVPSVSTVWRAQISCLKAARPRRWTPSSFERSMPWSFASRLEALTMRWSMLSPPVRAVRDLTSTTPSSRVQNHRTAAPKSPSTMLVLLLSGP